VFYIHITAAVPIILASSVCLFLFGWELTSLLTLVSCAAWALYAEVKGY